MDDFEIFNGKSFKELCKDIYDRSLQKKLFLEKLVEQISNLVKTVDDAVQLVPLIKGYMEVSVKNDELLVRLAQVVKRVTQDKRGDEILSDEEKEKIMSEIKSINSEIVSLNVK